MQLICNADDFGHSKGVNLGIVEAYQNGVVRSTTMMAGMPGFDHAVGLARQNPGLKIGVHLTLTAGKSVGGVYKTITDEEGNFFKLGELERRARASELDLAEVEAEYESQIKKIQEQGIEFDHFDSHHHTHNLPGNIDVFLKLAKKYNTKVRIYDKSRLTGDYASIQTTDTFIDTFFDEQATASHFKEICEQHPHESLELMCHPAYLDYELSCTSLYNIQRTVELHILTSDEIRNFISEKNIRLSSFSE